MKPQFHAEALIKIPNYRRVLQLKLGEELVDEDDSTDANEEDGDDRVQ